jgi:hypothetical protein
MKISLKFLVDVGVGRAAEAWMPERFEEIMFPFIQRGFEEMPANTFFEALALLDEKEQEETIEVEGEIVDGQLFLSVPTTTIAPIHAKDNVILLDKRKIVVQLKSSPLRVPS